MVGERIQVKRLEFHVLTSARMLAILLATAVICGVSAVSTQASNITFSTPSGSTMGGLPVNASVNIVTGPGTVTVTLSNLQSNPTAVIQNLSDLLIQFSDNVGTASLASSSAQEVSIAGNKSFALGPIVSTGWDFSTPAADEIYLNVLGSAIGPAHTLIGPPGGATYSSANGSIAGNGPHNPFLSQTATFNILASGITEATKISAVTFSFGTTSGNDILVPEPASLALGGLGLGLVVFGYRRR